MAPRRSQNSSGPEASSARGSGSCPRRANVQPALGYYFADPTASIWRASGLLVLTLSNQRVCGITRFGDKALLARFGLPRTLPRLHQDDDEERLDIRE